MIWSVQPDIYIKLANGVKRRRVISLVVILSSVAGVLGFVIAETSVLSFRNSTASLVIMGASLITMFGCLLLLVVNERVIKRELSSLLLSKESNEDEVVDGEAEQNNG